MIQLRKIRSYTPKGEDKPRTSDKPMPNDIVAPNIRELFAKMDEYVGKIAPEERWNVFYTLGHADHGDKRHWNYQEVMPIDIDEMIVKDDGTFDDKYIDVACKVLGVSRKKVGLVASGNGLHIIIGLKERIDSANYFNTYRLHYRVLMSNIQAALDRAGLPAKCDATSFAPNRILRCPGTVNRKPGKKDKTARLLNGNVEPLDWDLIKATGLPKVKDVEQINTRQLNSFSIDVEAVEAGCGFLKHCRENPNDLDEPTWYAMLSVTSRLCSHGEDAKAGRDVAHRYSKGYDGYDAWQTDRKIDQALAASGPRTCANIDALWDGCKECEHFDKGRSPISIRGDKFIATEHTGFHLVDEKGKYVPQFEDLCRYLKREHSYIVNKDNGGVYIYTGKHYEPWTSTQLRAYAHKHFFPTPMERTVQEFVAWVTRTNLIDNSWFKDTVTNRINFNNGVLDLGTGEMYEHEPTYGFLHCLPFDYSPKEECPVFESFLVDITSGDASLAKLLLEFIGYSLCSSDYWLQKGLLLVGNGANGKSTLLSIISALAGQKNTSYLSLGELQNETSRINLEGKLLNISDELPSYNFRNTEMFKKLMGGSVTARRLYQQTSTLQCNTKFIFSCNAIPKTSDTSNGLFRRLAIVPFDATFDLGTTADVDIAGKMMPELSGIFNQCYRAYQDCRKRGHLAVAERAEREVAWYRSSVDRVGTWIRDNIRWNGSWTDADPSVILDEVFDDYNSEARRSEEKPCTKREFTQQLRTCLDHWDERYVRRRRGGDRHFVLRGVWYTDGSDASF